MESASHRDEGCLLRQNMTGSAKQPAAECTEDWNREGKDVHLDAAMCKSLHGAPAQHIRSCQSKVRTKEHHLKAIAAKD